MTRFFLSRKSRTTTVPSLTVVFVPAQVSVIVHFVPRTVADELRPRVRKRPFTLENSERPRFFRFAEPPAGTRRPHAPSPPPLIEIVVREFLRGCPTVKTPPPNSPCCAGLPAP